MIQRLDLFSITNAVRDGAMEQLHGKPQLKYVTRPVEIESGEDHLAKRRFQIDMQNSESWTVTIEKTKPGMEL